MLGLNTIAQIQAGSVMGYIGAMEYLIRQTKREMGYGQDVKVVATGGLARLIADNTDMIDVVDGQLILDGLRIIYERLQAGTEGIRQSPGPCACARSGGFVSGVTLASRMPGRCQLGAEDAPRSPWFRRR